MSQQPSIDSRNVILAVVLAALILFGWPYVQNYFFPAPPVDVTEAKVATEKSGVPTAEGAAKTVVPLKTALAGGPRVLVETPKVKGSIALTGARIDDLVLTQHRISIEKDSGPVRLLSPSGTKDAYFAELGWTGDGVAVPTKDTVWTPSAQKLTAETPVTLTWDNKAGQVFEIALTIDKDYMISAKQRVTNRGAAAVSVTPYGSVSRVGISKDPSTWNIHVGPMGVFDGLANYDWDFKDVAEAEGARVALTNTDWLGFTDHYWLTALVPVGANDTRGYFLHAKDGDVYNARIQSDAALSVAPGKVITTETRVFSGAKEVAVLEGYAKNLDIPLFDRAIDWGWFWFIIKPLLVVLGFLFKLFGNFGLAIIGLTFIVRLLLFPIAQKQFASMAAMRAIQPKQKEIQEKHKDDKQRQQQEIMKLYKEEKVNPLAGCLPIFLQIPIFFALYKALMLSIDMRHQPFALWIKDLAAPDPLTPVNLFGLLPFDPPTFLAIGVLPILVGFTMWIQQKLNPAPADPVQQQVFAIMPWALMFVMAPFAAGLQLYWATGNLLTIAQQKWLYSRHPQLKASAQKEAEEKAAQKAKS